jgi:DNA-binding transcriptional regulator GbsR (MarR family)
MALSEIERRFVMHWGEMGARWGVNRTVAQIHALLYLSPDPLPAETISTLLDVARSNVSTSLRELQNWNLVRTVHLMEDRRDHFQTSRDVWALFKTVALERKAREFDPTVALLSECVNDPAFRNEPEEIQKRMRETLELMELISTWGKEMLTLEPATIKKILKLGAKIQNLIRKG